jgi:hypothetical protein
MGKSRAVSPRVGLAQVGGIGLPGELATIKESKEGNQRGWRGLDAALASLK